MPNNELETHPNWDYLGENPDYSKFHSIIIGSFPIYAINHSDPVEQDGINRRANWNQYAFFQFYYGSINSTFWNDSFPIAVTGNGLKQPPTLEDAKALLVDNGFLIADIIKSTQRTDYSALDNDLFPIDYNENILELLRKMSGNNIFFTALNNGNKNPFCWFKKLLRTKGLYRNRMFQQIGTRNCTFTLNNKLFNVGLLFSPSPNGARAQNHIPEFVNYQIQYPLNNYTDFRKEQWKQLLRFKNFAYDGSNPVYNPIPN